MNSFAASTRKRSPWAGERTIPGLDGDMKLEQLHRYALAMELADGKDVLDVASSEGYGAMLLSSKARTVLGVDNAANAITQATGQYQAPNLQFKIGFAHELPLPDDSMDLVVSFETIHRLVEHEKFLSEVKRVLRPGGKFLLSSSNQALQAGGRDEDPYFKYLSPGELRELISASFVHQQWLAQRVCYGSIAYGLDESPVSRLRAYDGDFEHVRNHDDSILPPSFLVLCSDDPIEPLPSSVFENPAAFDQLRNAVAAVEQPLSKRIRELEVRISRMETSTWWRLRKPIKFITDILLRRPPTGLFTPPRERPVKMRGYLPDRIRRVLNADEKKAGSLLTANQDLPAVSSGEIASEIAVIIPVYNNVEEVQLCLASVLRYTSLKHKIIVIDDCSTDVRIWPMLQRLAAEYPQVEIHRNSVNRGYLATVNRGLTLCNGDVVVTHSNVYVTQKWLHKLAHAAAKFPLAATISPLVNGQGPFGIPLRPTEGGGPPPTGIADIADVVERLSHKIFPEVPTANPECMYIRRDALEKSGGLNEDGDFPTRAKQAGFIHVLEDTTFVFQKRHGTHHKERRLPMSSGGRNSGLLHRQSAIPDEISRFLSNDPLAKMRRDVCRELNQRSENLQRSYRKEMRRRRKNAILYVVQEGTGGSVFTAEDLVRKVSDTHACYLLRTSFQQWSFYRCTHGEFHLLRRFQFDRPWLIDNEFDEQRSQAFADLLGDFHFAIAHIRHLLGTAPEIISKLKESGVAVVFSFHDFYTVCPNIQLIDNHRQFCAGRCSRDSQTNSNGNANGSNEYRLHENGNGQTCADCKVPGIWPLVTLAQPLKHHYVHDWRTRVRHALEQCDGFVTTSKFSTHILMQHFEFLRRKDVRIIEHGRDLSAFRPAGVPPTDQTVRVAYFGALQTFKGAELLAEIMRLDRAGKKRFEFHILGSIARSTVDPRRLGAIYHGRYKREQLADLIEQIKPSFAIIPSIWPETFCHTLTEAWAMGLPVFASNLGALKERIQAEGGGWLIDPQSPQKWYDTMLTISDDLAEYDRQIRLIQQHPLKTTHQMAMEYIDFYDAILETAN
ncbi:MAG TPA: methyltransferase domain-containing protein [Chthoniobacterales bacterium]